MKDLSFDRLVIGLLFGAVVLTACLMPAQADTYWHLRAGEDMWRTHHVSMIETYSYTAAGSFWPNHEWFWQAVSYGLYRAGGMPLLTAASALVVTAAFVLSYRLMTGPPLSRFVLMILGVPIGACVWALRPQIVSLALVMLLVTLIARERHRLLPLLFVVWANVHGAVALGVAILAAAAVAAIVRARSGDPADRRRAWRLVALTPICVLATAATPLGFRLWTFIAQSIERSHATMIGEWQPAYPKGFVEIGFWVLALAFVYLLIRRRRNVRSWSDLALVAAAVVVLPLAARAVRNIAPFLLLAIPAASRLLGPQFRFRRAVAGGPVTAQAVEHPRLNLALLVGLVLAGMGAVAFAWTTRLPMLGWQPLGADLIAAVRACPDSLYNHYNEGGYLVWFVPERKVFIDSRQDPYSLPFLLEHGRVESGKAPYEPLFARWNIRCAFLRVESPTVKRLVVAGWGQRFRDDKWVVLVEPGAAANAR
jgi:hypothetical protein